MTRAEIGKIWEEFADIPINSDDETSHAQTLETQKNKSRRVPCDL
jgi:hypothetical protein